MQFQIAQKYEEVSRFLDREFNYPAICETFTKQDFEREYDAAFDIIAEELSMVGVVDTDGFGEGDFSMSRYVDLNRSINVVAYTPVARSFASIVAAHAALQKLHEEYVVSFDAHPSYISVRRDGTVIGYCGNEDLSILRAFGFPP
jgi:hypothetical protein